MDQDEPVGNCYFAAFAFFMKNLGLDGIKLVHGVPLGQGPIAGVRFGHAWVEIGDTVIDPSNGRFIVQRKERYYAIGHIETVVRYGRREVCARAVETETHGPWDPSVDI